MSGNWASDPRPEGVRHSGPAVPQGCWFLCPAWGAGCQSSDTSPCACFLLLGHLKATVSSCEPFREWTQGVAGRQRRLPTPEGPQPPPVLHNAAEGWEPHLGGTGTPPSLVPGGGVQGASPRAQPGLALRVCGGERGRPLWGRVWQCDPTQASSGQRQRPRRHIPRAGAGRAWGAAAARRPAHAHSPSRSGSVLTAHAPAGVCALRPAARRLAGTSAGACWV